MLVREQHTTTKNKKPFYKGRKGKKKPKQNTKPSTVQMTDYNKPMQTSLCQMISISGMEKRHSCDSTAAAMCHPKWFLDNIVMITVYIYSVELFQHKTLAETTRNKILSGSFSTAECFPPRFLLCVGLIFMPKAGTCCDLTTLLVGELFTSLKRIFLLLVTKHDSFYF